MAASALARTLQQRLEGLYDLQLPQRLDDFVFTDAALAQQLRGDARNAREQLLLRCDQDGLAMSLYLDAGLLEGAAAEVARPTGEGRALDALAAVIEGVSHFVYVAWRAQTGGVCSQLELELQAEIDKFALLHQIWREREHAAPQTLHQRLFEQGRLAMDLSAEERQRYTLANSFAARYCHGLQRRFQGRLDHPEARNQLRRFYRASQPDKLAWAGSSR